MPAQRILHFKESNPDETVIEMVVWAVPVDQAHPHGFKYHLHFGTQLGQCIVRYDNETGKGDHKHIGNKEMPYEFDGLKKLLDDFHKDVEKYRRTKPWTRRK